VRTTERLPLLWDCSPRTRAGPEFPDRPDMGAVAFVTFRRPSVRRRSGGSVRSIRGAFAAVVLVLVAGTVAAGCGVVQDGVRGLRNRDCPTHVRTAVSQIDTASAKLRSVQDSSSDREARIRATTGVTGLRRGLAAMRDHGDCFAAQDRTWAVRNLQLWRDPKAVDKVVSCYDTKLQEGSAPEFCDFRR
jgi:hypothetical protein